MRIGTWNLAGRWTPEHADFLIGQECDVWLLTEVSERLSLDGFHLHPTAQPMAPLRRWAAVLSRRPLAPLPDPHPASAAARVGGLTFCSSVLPWRSCGARLPWLGTAHETRTKHAVGTLVQQLPRQKLVWGGDWNHALEGPEYVGSKGGRDWLLKAVAELGLQVPTATLPHRIEGLLSIDHLAVGVGLQTSGAARVLASAGDGWLSDHDAYVVDLPA